MPNPSEALSRSKDDRQQLVRRKGWLHRLLIDVFFVAKRDKTWWLLPLILLLLMLAGLLGIAALSGPLAPFIYPVL